MNTKPINAIGMVWYLAEDFGEIKALMEDGHRLHRTYAEWQRAAEQGEQAMRTKGVRVYRAMLRPAPFKAWCVARGLNVDAKARNQFASEFASQEYRAGR
jgi:hypothetical protein